MFSFRDEEDRGFTATALYIPRDLILDPRWQLRILYFISNFFLFFSRRFTLLNVTLTLVEEGDIYILRYFLFFPYLCVPSCSEKYYNSIMKTKQTAASDRAVE